MATQAAEDVLEIVTTSIRAVVAETSHMFPTPTKIIRRNSNDMQELDCRQYLKTYHHSKSVDKGLLQVIG